MSLKKGGIFFLLGGFLFSWWLMEETFSYREGRFFIAAKVWSDFASHLPLIRSFSFGANWPPQDPLFPGPMIHYHFLFYALVGLLEKIGLPLNWALNLPSSLGFLALMAALYLFALCLFQKQSVAILGVIFFLFNGSFSFWEFFKDHPLSPNIIWEILQNEHYPSFSPYGKGVVSAFWNLNIYTNQRHLAPAFAAILATLLMLISPILKDQKISFRRAILAGAIFGLFPFFHSAGYLMILAITAVFFLSFSGHRLKLALTLALTLTLGLSQLLLTRGPEVGRQLQFFPGYLIANQLSIKTFLSYWFANLGLNFILIPLAFFLVTPTQRKILLAFFLLFIIGNLFRFSPEIAANHKFFNLFVIVANIYSASILVRLFQKGGGGKLIVLPIVFLLTFSGIIDFFPLKNDAKIKIADYPQNEEIAWIKNRTSPQSVFLNSSYLYHPASLAGRKIYLGWPYFPWSAGHDTAKRESFIKNVYRLNDKELFCRLLKGKGIDYFTTEDTGTNPDLPRINFQFFENNFPPSFSSSERFFKIYSLKENCPS